MRRLRIKKVGKPALEAVQMGDADAGGQQRNAANHGELARRDQHRGGDAKAIEKPCQKWKLLPQHWPPSRSYMRTLAQEILS